MATKRDKAILNSLFNPLLPVGELFENDDLEEENDSSVSDDKCPAESKELELEGVRLAESDQTDLAIGTFNRAIKLGPLNASAFNNRAQALRLKGDIEGALSDLDSAINLSKGKGLVAKQSLCQRGIIHKLRKEDQLAVEDFKLAAKLGSVFAKNQLVQMNPYAALCNKMLGEMMTKLQNGEN